MFRDLKEAIRTLSRTPGMTAIVVATMAIVIGANATIFSALNGVVIRPLAYDAPEELVMLWENNLQQGQDQVRTSAATYKDWRDRSHTFEGIAAYRYLGYVLTGDGEPERIDSAQISPNLFRILRVVPILGRAFLPGDEAPGSERNIVLSHTSWSRRFGSDPAVIDRIITLDGEPHTIVGVMPEGFQFPPDDLDVEMWSPVTLGPEIAMGRPHRMFNTIGRLANDASIGQAQAEMDRIALTVAEENPDSNAGWGVTLVPALEQMVGSIRTTFWVLFCAVLFVLLIGCANIANILLAKSIRSSRDLAVRAAFGAGGFALVRRTFTEIAILVGAGGIVGLVITYWGIGVLRRHIPPTVPRVTELGIDGTVLLFTAGTVIIAGLLVGLVPGIRARRPNLVGVLQESGRGGFAGRRTRLLTGGLVICEVGLAVILLVGAVLMTRSYARLSSVDPGFRTEHVVSVAISLPPTRYPFGNDNMRLFFTQLVDAVKRLPGVESAGAVTRMPMSAIGIEFEAPITVEGWDAVAPTDQPRGDYRGVIAGYFETMGIPVIRGRRLDEFDSRNGRNVAIVNQRLAERFFSDSDPIGKIISIPMFQPMEIVGVVADVLHDGLQSDARPEVFIPFSQLPLNEMHIVMYTHEEPGDIASLVQGEVLKLDPELPITEVSEISDLLANSIAQSRFSMVLLIGLAFCAFILAVIGTYGVISYSVSQRTREIGLRMALGADARKTMRLIIVQTLRLVVIGMVLGILGGLALSRFLGSLLHNIAPIDIPTYVVVCVLILTAGLSAATVPARRASRVDPAEALRY